MSNDDKGMIFRKPNVRMMVSPSGLREGFFETRIACHNLPEIGTFESLQKEKTVPTMNRMRIILVLSIVLFFEICRLPGLNDFLKE